MSCKKAFGGTDGKGYDGGGQCAKVEKTSQHGDVESCYKKEHRETCLPGCIWAWRILGPFLVGAFREGSSLLLYGSIVVSEGAFGTNSRSRAA